MGVVRGNSFPGSVVLDVQEINQNNSEDGKAQTMMMPCYKQTPTRLPTKINHQYIAFKGQQIWSLLSSLDSVIVQY